MPRRVGFTLIELMVVVAVIGILVALLLPAVQQAREAARRAACKNNLHQLGVALHNYHDAHSSLPPGSITRDGSIYGKPRMPFYGGLLPHIDQANLYNKLLFHTNSYLFKDPQNADVVGTPIPAVRCPSDGYGGDLKELPPQDNMRVAVMNYAGISGRLQRDVVAGSAGEPDAGAGQAWPFAVNRVVALGAFKDGTSNSIVLAEVLTGSRRDLRGEMWIGNAAHTAVFTELGPNSVNPDVLFRDSTYILCNEGDPDNQNPTLNLMCVEGDSIEPNSLNTSASRSRHEGGVQVLLGDGSVRFVSENVSLALWRNLGSINDGEVVGEF